jgi:membrane protease YdiL (CAAX protease family)
MRKDIHKGTIIFLLGLIGIFSILTMELPIPQDAKEMLDGLFSPGQIKLLALINPAILLLIATIVGVILHEKVALRSPIIESFVHSTDIFQFRSIANYGIAGGIITGGLLSFFTNTFTPILPREFLQLSESLAPSLPARFLYGGITEEIMMRFGLMTLIVWIAFKATKKLNNRIYWIGIILSSLVFAAGHLPVVYSIMASPPAELIGYVLLGNTVGGLIFGWLYWKKGLESAMMAHIFAHITMLASEVLFLPA